MIRHLYVHVPFCAKICPYCSFYKSEASEGGFDAFVEAVLAEAASHRGTVLPQTVFFGGGTPTALGNRHLRTLIEGLAGIFDFSDVTEFTVEMNPATIPASKASLLRSLGVNRASLGVQSWEPGLLLALGRTHSAEAALRSYEVLRSSGFENINLDHIFAIPGQTAEDWEQTLHKTAGLRPEHISAYSLTYEEDTEFFLRLGRGELKVDPELDIHLFESAMGFLEGAGFEQYETSNYALPGRECLHNFAYWRGNDYLGLGPSAVSTVLGVRSANIADTRLYVESCLSGNFPSVSREVLSQADLRLERLALGLRTREGVPSDLARKESVTDCIKEGLLTSAGGRIHLTRKARSLADEIVLALA